MPVYASLLSAIVYNTVCIKLDYYFISCNKWNFYIKIRKYVMM